MLFDVNFIFRVGVFSLVLYGLFNIAKQRESDGIELFVKVHETEEDRKSGSAHRYSKTFGHEK